MLNSAKHENYLLVNSKLLISTFFSFSVKLSMKFSLFMKMKMPTLNWHFHITQQTKISCSAESSFKSRPPFVTATGKQTGYNKKLFLIKVVEIPLHYNGSGC